MCKSLLNELRFIIGEQYELNEFNLKTLEPIFINGLEYECYEYIKSDFNTLFGVEFSKNIILQYNGDILSRVVYEFDIDSMNIVKDKASQIILDTIIIEVLTKGKKYCQLITSKK